MKHDAKKLLSATSHSRDRIRTPKLRFVLSAEGELFIGKMKKGTLTITGILKNTCGTPCNLTVGPADSSCEFTAKKRSTTKRVSTTNKKTRARKTR